MTVHINSERKGIEIAWETGDYDGQIQVFGVGNEGDVHNSAPGANDGLASLSYPKGFTGRSAIEIRKADGSGEIVDSGVIIVGSSSEDSSDGGEIGPDDPHPEHLPA